MPPPDVPLVRARGPADYRGVSPTIAHVRNLQKGLIHPGTIRRISNQNIKCSLRRSLLSRLCKVGGARQPPQRSVHRTTALLDQVIKLSRRPAECPTGLRGRPTIIHGENRELSPYYVQQWKPAEERFLMKFNFLVSNQAVERLQGLRVGNNRHKDSSKLASPSWFGNPDPSRSLGAMNTELPSDHNGCDAPGGGRELGPVRENALVTRKKSLPPGSVDDPKPLDTGHIVPGQAIELLNDKGHPNIQLPKLDQPLGPSLVPNPLVSQDYRASWRPEGADVQSALGTSDTLPVTSEEGKAGGATTDVISQDAEPGQPPSGFIFKDWAASNIRSFADLYKPAVLDYSPIRDMPNRGSFVFMVGSAVKPCTLTTFWRSHTITGAYEIFRWMNAYRDAALGIVNSLNIPLSERNIENTKGSTWTHIFYPRNRFIQDMRKEYKRMYGEPSWNEAEIFQLLQTCGTCRSLTIEGLLERGHILDEGGRPLLDFSIRFDGTSVVFNDFLRHILVPPSQTYISPGETLTITPVLYDPHQPPDDLSTRTSFEVSSQFGWLGWDASLRGFVGTVPQSVFRELNIQKTSEAQRTFVVDMPITAKTVTAFPGSTRHETTVRSQIKLQITKTSTVEIGRGNVQIDKSRPSTTPITESTGPDTTQDWTKDGQRASREPEQKRCVNCDGVHSLPAVWGSQIAEDQPPHDGSGNAIFLWGQGCREWINLEFLVDPSMRGAQHHKFPVPEGRPLSFKDLNLRRWVGSSYLWMDRVENHIFRIGAELEMAAEYGTPSPLQRRICHNLEVSTGAIGVFHERDTMFPPCSTSIGPIDTIDGKAIGQTNGIQPSNALPRPTTSWAKVILTKLLKLLACFRRDFDETIKLSIHVGIEAVSGYDLREIKTIAKAIVLFGGLLNGTGLSTNPGHNKCCPDPTKRISADAKHIEAIDEAPTAKDVAQLMSSLEALGYTYHGQPGIENQRYDFSCLESKGVIIWTQTFPKFKGMDVLDWISMILHFNRAAISMDSSVFADLAERPITIANLRGFMAKC